VNKPEFPRAVKEALTAVAAAVAAAFVLALPASAKTPPGTGVSASKTSAGHLTATYAWTIGKSADPSGQMVAVGTSATVHWTITVGRSTSGALGAYLDGQVCVTNTGTVATQGLAISDQLTKPPSKTVLNTVTVDVSAKPVLAAGASFCYPHKITVPAAAIAPGATYKDTASVTITNQSGSPGTPKGASPSATVALPTIPSPVDSSISVSDTNGQTFTFSSAGSQGYDQSVACTTADGAHTISDSNTATIQSTGQTATGQATVHCGAPTTLTTALSASSIHTDGSVSDQATIVGAASNAGGTITYKVYGDSSCGGTAVADATPTSNTVSNASAPASMSVTFNSAGTYYWQAVYSGDADHNTLGSTSDCSSEKLTVTSCTPGTIGCPWQNGDMLTYSQGTWSTDPAASSLVTDHYSSLYAAGLFEVGVSGSAGFSMIFTNAVDLLKYIPTSGTIGPLTSDLINPTTTESGAFGGEVTALKLNIDFSDASLVHGTAGIAFGSLTLCGFTSTPALNDTTVRQFSSTVNTLLGGGSSTYTISDLDPIAANLNTAFLDSTPSTWAQQHLVNGACRWHNGDLTTYVQASWGTGPASTLLLNNFYTVYASALDLFVIGDTSKYTVAFDSPQALSSYLPQTGSPGVLTASLLDPTISAAGSFGGNIAALKLNIDFADAGDLPAGSGLKFGDLTICGLTSDTDLNGQTVRQFLDTGNTALGGGAHTDSISDLDAIGTELNVSFAAGITVSTWAENHLVAGPCP
jgi:hypothetical protein